MFFKNPLDNFSTHYPYSSTNCNFIQISLLIQFSVIYFRKHVMKYHPDQNSDIDSDATVMSNSETMWTFRCSKCPKNFMTQAMLIKHNQTHAPSQEATLHLSHLWQIVLYYRLSNGSQRTVSVFGTFNIAFSLNRNKPQNYLFTANRPMMPSSMQLMKIKWNTNARNMGSHSRKRNKWSKFHLVFPTNRFIDDVQINIISSLILLPITEWYLTRITF